MCIRIKNGLTQFNYFSPLFWSRLKSGALGTCHPPSALPRATPLDVIVLCNLSFCGNKLFSIYDM